MRPPRLQRYIRQLPDPSRRLLPQRRQNRYRQHGPVVREASPPRTRRRMEADDHQESDRHLATTRRNHLANRVDDQQASDMPGQSNRTHRAAATGALLTRRVVASTESSTWWVIRRCHDSIAPRRSADRDHFPNSVSSDAVTRASGWSGSGSRCCAGSLRAGIRRRPHGVWRQACQACQASVVVSTGAAVERCAPPSRATEQAPGVCLEPRRGVEPLTYALRVRCSTD